MHGQPRSLYSITEYVGKVKVYSEVPQYFKYGNDIADNLARLGAWQPIVDPESVVGIADVHFRLR